LIELNRNKGTGFFTITPEFDAPSYMVLHPKAGESLVNQWDINVWMMNELKRRYIPLG